VILRKSYLRDHPKMANRVKPAFGVGWW